ncbi:hypothetical protein HPB50_009971 [Hyalomma asiaticum]|uniref:Uncharacterized protein n=1 Tax=Hyalomma asiaticum TaxID=266040 RepID=A0ACB7RZ84_HYAAI|nr:hypothetical protein HPB50_009971 [Hyalomma asiaticum]
MGRLLEKNPYNKAEAKASFKEFSEAYEVLPGEFKRPQFDLHDRGGQDTGHHADFVSSWGVNAHNTWRRLRLHTSRPR